MTSAKLRKPERAAKQVSAKPAKRSSGYPAHRERQRQRILAAAETLFTSRGIDRVTMADITGTSGVQASTVYQYFTSKNDLVWAVTGAVLQESTLRTQALLAHATTGFEKVHAVLDSMAHDLEHHAEKVRFMAQFDALYAHDLPVEQLLLLEEQLGLGSFEALCGWVEEGIADGSLRTGLDPKSTMHGVLNAAIGAQRRLASLSAKVEREYGRPVNVLFGEAMRVILAGLRAEPQLPRCSPKKRGNQQQSPKLKRS